jgi:hypothetical protein
VDAAVDELKAVRKRLTLRELSWKELRDAGRP